MLVFVLVLFKLFDGYYTAIFLGLSLKNFAVGAFADNGENAILIHLFI